MHFRGFDFISWISFFNLNIEEENVLINSVEVITLVSESILSLLLHSVVTCGNFRKSSIFALILPGKCGIFKEAADIFRQYLE